MTPKQVEAKVVDLIQREPFVPFVVEMADGHTVQISHPRLAVNGGGAGFIAAHGGLVDIEFKKVRAIRILSSGAVA